MSDEKKMRAFFEALADNLESLSDEQLLAEVREDGRSPDDIAKQTRSLIQETVKEVKQRALVVAREKHQQYAARLESTRIQLPTNPAERRLLFDAVINQQRVARTLTAQYRNLQEITDEDVESCLHQLAVLGLLGKISDSEK